MPDPVRALAANYLRVGKWSQCAHCHIVHSGPWDHYCGAEWQTPEMGFVVGEGIDEIRPEWAAAARALREPSDEDVAREMSGYEPGTVGFRSCLEDVQSVRAAAERARGMR